MTTRKQWGYVSPDTKLGEIYGNEGSYMAAQPLGFLTITGSWLPKPPGHISNSCSFDFPVRYYCIDGGNQKTIHSGDMSILDVLIQTAKQAEADGCRAICGDCGYFGNFQAPIAEAVNIPAYLSSVVQVPWVKAGLRRGQKVGVICADGPHLTVETFRSCGMTAEDYDNCIIYGGNDRPLFNGLMYSPGRYDCEELKQEILSIAKMMMYKNPEVGAIVIECTDIPPYSHAVMEDLNIPVYDAITFLHFVHDVVCQKPCYGFL